MSDEDLTVVALTALAGYRAVTSFGGYASQRTDAALAVLGIVETAARAGDAVRVRRTGTLTWPAANLIPNQPMFLSDEGRLTQTPPTAGWLRTMGMAIDADLIEIEVGPAYFLGEP